MVLTSIVERAFENNNDRTKRYNFFTGMSVAKQQECC